MAMLEGEINKFLFLSSCFKFLNRLKPKALWVWGIFLGFSAGTAEADEVEVGAGDGVEAGVGSGAGVSNLLFKTR